jgi:curved DNA-binding protein CbpA
LPTLLEATVHIELPSADFLDFSLPFWLNLARFSSCMTDHYAVLHLRSSATLAEIKKAFRQQASIHHPDRNPAPEAAARFRAVQEAYDVLSDAVRRKAYDDNRQRNLLDSPIDTAREIWAAYFSRIV